MSILGRMNVYLFRATGRKLLRPQTGNAELFDAILAHRTQNAGQLEREFLAQALLRSCDTHSQLLQDLWVLFELESKRNGFFVELGAGDGVNLSNTELLERAYGWEGILAEPDPRQHDDITRNRRAVLDRRCVVGSGGPTVPFALTAERELSTIAHMVAADCHAAERRSAEVVRVPTVTLSELLREHRAPEVIDYLSVDTEGSELAILAGFDWSRTFRCITLEHNYTPRLGPITQLLATKGFQRRFASLSKWDAWFVHRDLVAGPATM